MLIRFIWTAVLCLTLAGPAFAAPPNLARLHVDTTPVKNVRDLVQTCDLIVSGRTDSHFQSAPTGVSLGHGKVHNYVQSFRVQRTWKGSAPQVIKLLTTGIEPLPDARDPLNLTYPGPLSEGEYVLFLKKVHGTNLYRLVGVWQGVYPVQGGRTIALLGAGFAELNGLSLDQIAQTLQRLQTPSR
ncbi:hypothetical protein ACQKK5_22605 [Brevibacillus panacihumi]|uniref:hypothetical protein n=1 Tax=Brevibacillus panacihumi TaxID=497735 RepID=UPI003D003535